MQLNTIKKMERYARENSSIISLGQGIPAGLSDQRIRESVVQRILDGHVDHYSDPQGIAELRMALSDHLRHYSMAYSPNEIIVTAGAIEALGVAVRSVMTNEKAEIIVAVPAYSAYFKLIELAGGKVVEIPLNEEDGWSLDADKIINAMSDKTAAVLLCNPNNPTGSVYPRKTLEAITQAAHEIGIAVIIDEVYRNMIFDGTEFYTPASEPLFRDTVIRVTSFSKDFSLTGWRIGYLHASSKRIPKLLGIHDTLINCTPVVSQYAAIAALAIYGDVISKNRNRLVHNLNLMASKLDEISNLIDYQLPQGAYFFFPKLRTSELSAHVAMSLLRSGIAIIPGSAFGNRGEGHIRLCFGRDERSIEEGMNRLVRYFSKEVVV